MRIRSGLAVAAAAAVVLGGAAQAQAAPPSGPASVPASAPRVLQATTNGLSDPIGLDTKRPLLSWTYSADGAQRAYQLRAAASVADLRRGTGVVTGPEVESSTSTHVPFRLQRLHARDSVAWQVRVRDRDGRVSPWSDPATFELGLLRNRNWDAQWIENPGYDYTQPDGTETPLPAFAKTFKVRKQVTKARLYASGLGMYAATVNGQPASDAVLEPGQTTYGDEVNYRVYDVTEALRRGENVVGFETGSGTYQRVKTPGRYFFGNTLEQYVVYGEPKVIGQLELEFADGSRKVVGTDASWRTALSPTTYSSWWAGEEYDARRAATAPTSPSVVAGSGWSAAALAQLTSTTTPRATTPLIADPRPPVVAQHAYPATSITRVGDSYVLDFGANRSGWPTVDPDTLPAGATVTMIPSEKLTADGTLDTASTGVREGSGAIAYRYTAAGGDQPTWHPKFTYSGFRYLRLDGLTSAPSPDLVTQTAVFADNERASTFHSSSAVLNGVHDMTLRSIEGNMMSVLTDCPDREKGPYTGDNLHNIDALLTDFDMAAYQPQLVRNMATAQRKPGDESPGLIANIAPEFHRVLPTRLTRPQGVIEFLDEVNWGGAVIRIPWQLYTTYGDTETMRRYYPHMKRWLAYEAANRAANNGDIPGLGDWSAQDNTTPMQLAIYAGYYTAADDMSKVAGVLGKKKDVTTYAALAQELKTTFASRFRQVDAGGVYYGSDSEASNAMALDAGLVSKADRPAVRARLVAAVQRAGNHITTGSVGVGPLFRALQDAGRDDVIYDMVVNPTSPGYGYLLAAGNTTLAEDFAGRSSQNHHFLGQVDNWYVAHLAGIQQADGSVGYRRLVIDPALLDEVDRARGSYDTPYGTVRSAWQRKGDRVVLRVTVPSGTTAKVAVGRAEVRSGGARRVTGGYRVQPGTYVFTIR